MDVDAEILDTVRRLAAEAFDLPESAIDAQSSPETIESWDSLQQLNLMMSIEDTFSVVVDPTDMDSLTDVASIAAFVERIRSGG